MLSDVYVACIKWHGKHRMKQRAGLILDFEMDELIRRRIAKALRTYSYQTNLCRLLEGEPTARATWWLAIGDKMIEVVYDYDLGLVVTVKDVKRRKQRLRR